MAKQRMINTKFWSDPWVMTKMNSLDRLLFLYLLTNEHTNISGIYEISEHKIAFDTGLERETLIKAMFPRLAPKAYFMKDWVIMVNFPKHQNTDNPKISEGIQRELENVPNDIYTTAIGYGYPIHRLSHLTKLNLTKLTGDVVTSRGLSSPSEEELNTVPVDDNGDPIQPRQKADTTYRKIFNLFGNYPKNWNQNRTEIAAAKNILEEHGIEKATYALLFFQENKHEPHCPQILKPSDLDRKWVNLQAMRDKNG